MTLEATMLNHNRNVSTAWLCNVIEVFQYWTNKLKKKKKNVAIAF